MSAASTPALDRYLAVVCARLRIRRGFTAALAAVGVLSIVSAVMTVLARTGLGPPWPLGRAWLGVAAAVVALAAAGSSLLPVRERQLAIRIDRRLGLDAALLTSLEVRDSDDPVCRLLVSRTTGALRTIPARKALPIQPPAAALMVPALLVLAAGLSLRAAPAAPPDSTGPVATSRLAEAAPLSGRIQAIASRIVVSDGWEPQEITDSGRRLLAIDEALARGQIGAREAEAAVSKLLEDLSTRPSPGSGPRAAGGSLTSKVPAGQGPTPPPAAGRAATLAALLEILHSGAEGAAGASVGRSAGRGRAAPGSGEAPAPLREEDRARAAAAWWLPPAQGPAPRAGSGRFEGPRRSGRTLLMTPPEEAAARRYFESLQRRSAASPAVPGGGRSAGSPQRRDP